MVELFSLLLEVSGMVREIEVENYHAALDVPGAPS